MVELCSRFKGALIGCFIGDALGRPFEGASPADPAVGRDLARRLVSAGTWNYTDDTEMMVGVAESLVRCQEVVAEDMLRTMAVHCEPGRGYGKGARITFDAFLRGKDARSAPFVAWPEGSRGNGASVRVGPVACVYHEDLATLEYAAEESAAITLAHRVGRAGCVLYALGMAAALNIQIEAGFDRSDFLLRLAGKISERDSVMAEKLRIAAGLVQNPPGPREAVKLLGNGVCADESVPMALYAFAAWYPSFEGVVTATIEHGGDTDTIAAMSGGLIGAALGTDAISQDWIARLENGPRGRDHVLYLGDELFRLWSKIAKRPI